MNELQPTAELRPLEDNQTDERDLMPYPLLNRIERLAFYNRLSPSQVLAALKAENEALDPAQLTTYVKRFFSLWSRNQWKRERYAPRLPPRRLQRGSALLAALPHPQRWLHRGAGGAVASAEHLAARGGSAKPELRVLLHGVVARSVAVSNDTRSSGFALPPLAAKCVSPI